VVSSISAVVVFCHAGVTLATRMRWPLNMMMKQVTKERLPMITIRCIEVFVRGTSLFEVDRAFMRFRWWRAEVLKHRSAGFRITLEVQTSTTDLSVETGDLTCAN
jgi:hypothetical protein